MTYAISPTIKDTYAAGVDDKAYEESGDGFFGRTSLAALGLTDAEIDAVLKSPLANKIGISISLENYMTYVMESGDTPNETVVNSKPKQQIISPYDPTQVNTANQLNALSGGMNKLVSNDEPIIDDNNLSPGWSGFDQDSPVKWRQSNMKPSDKHFDTEFKPEKVQIRDDGSMLMTLDPNPGGEFNFTGAEISSSEPVLYGRFDMRMRPSSEPGVVSSMFTYTGPHEGNAHDEIDIEFLGKHPNKIQVGMFRNGKQEATLIDLGFNASESFNDYAFEWAPDGIKWYVNDELVHEFKASDGYDIPKSPQRLFSNLWACDVDSSGWAGLKDRNASASMEISGYSYTPLD